VYNRCGGVEKDVVGGVVELWVGGGGNWCWCLLLGVFGLLKTVKCSKSTRGKERESEGGGRGKLTGREKREECGECVVYRNKGVQGVPWKGVWWRQDK